MFSILQESKLNYLGDDEVIKRAKVYLKLGVDVIPPQARLLK